MNKKIIGILAAVAVVVIIILVAMNKPRHSVDSDVLRNAMQQTEASADSAAVQHDSSAAPETATE